MKTKILLLTLTLAAITVPTARADLPNINITGEIRLGRRPPPPPPPVVVISAETTYRGGSPWERARGNQRVQGYYYYPGADVYYRSADRVWFYQERGRWRSGRNLPDYVRVDFNRSITLNMFTDQPYAFHQQVVTRYPSNYFGTRVRLRDNDHDGRDSDHDGRDRDRDRRDNDHDGRDSDHDGRDKDRGNRR